MSAVSFDNSVLQDDPAPRTSAEPAATAAPSDVTTMGLGAASRQGSYSLLEQAFFVYGTGLAIGLHLGLIHVFIFRTWSVLPVTLGATILFSSCTLGLWRWVFPRTSGWPTRARMTAQVLIALGAFAIVSVAVTELNAALSSARSMFQQYTGGDRVVTIPAHMLSWGPLVYTVIPVLPTAMMCIIGFNQHWWRIFRLEGRQRELHALATSAQLATLRAQVNPHFFFNSLNSIAQLISTDPEKAERCVERLADIYRYILTRSEVEFVSLADELMVAEAYLEIEKARFGDDLTVEAWIDDRARAARVPGLILQPLVENAIKHGISRKVGGGTVYIRAGLDDGELRLTVSDSGVGIRNAASAFDRGVGLRNVRDRLRNLYGEKFLPILESRAEGGTSVTLRIPISAEPMPT